MSSLNHILFFHLSLLFPQPLPLPGLLSLSVYLWENFSSPERPTSQPDAPLASVFSFLPFSPKLLKTVAFVYFSFFLIAHSSDHCTLPSALLPELKGISQAMNDFPSANLMDTFPSLLHQRLCFGYIDDYSLLLKTPLTSVILHCHDSLPNFSSFIHSFRKGFTWLLLRN